MACFTLFSTRVWIVSGGTSRPAASGSASSVNDRREPSRARVGQRHQPALAGVEREAEQRGQPLHHALGVIGIVLNERADGVERVEEKVRLQTGLERGQPGLQRQLAVALGLELAGAQLQRHRVEPGALGFI
jgi:hypothetical protein